MSAWFAWATVKSRRRQHELERVIDGLTVGDVMETVPFVVVPQATLDTFAEALDVGGEATVARVMRGEELLGLVGPREIARVPRARWPEVHAAEAMAALQALPALSPDEPLGPAAERLGACSASGLPVVSEGRMAGILTRLAVGRTLHERADGRRDAGSSPVTTALAAVDDVAAVPESAEALPAGAPVGSCGLDRS